MKMNFEENKIDLVNNEDVSLFGAFPSNGIVRFLLKVKKSLGVYAAAIVIHADGWDSGETVVKRAELTKLEECDEYDVFSIVISFAELLSKFALEGDGLFYYYYSVISPDREYSVAGELPTELIEIEHLLGERQLLIFDKDFICSEHFCDGVIYQIFVDRFKKSGRCTVKSEVKINPDWDNGTPQFAEYPGGYVANNEFFGGDLWGIADNIDYFSALGVKTIYLSPVFDAYSNHKYDTGDYMSVDSMFGGDEALYTLCRKAEEHGISVILDGVFNHTGDNSIYFNKYKKYPSIGAYNSKESKYFPWYHFSEFPDEYECWWGIKILPRVDSTNQNFREFICNEVVNKWMSAGIAGWRLDVADELSSTFLEDFRRSVKQNNKDAVIIGEVWEDATDKVSYGKRRRYLRGAQLDSVMNYPLRDGIIKYVKNGECEALRKSTEGLYRRYPKQCSDNMMNFLGTHDTERILTILGGVSSEGKTNSELSHTFMNDDERNAAVSLLKFAYSIIAGLPGVPCVFYGDEAGLEGYRDPFCRRPFPWSRIDHSLLDHYRKTGLIRRDNTLFRHGLFKILKLTPECFVYVRYNKQEKIIVAASRHGKLDLWLPANTEILGENKIHTGEYTINEREVFYFKIRNSSETAADDIKIV